MIIAPELDAFLGEFPFLEQEDKEAFAEIANVIHVKKGEIIIQEGHVHSKVYLMLSGLVRAYQTKENGEERTLWIGERGTPLSDPISLLSGSLSLTNFQVIEDADIVVFEKAIEDALEIKRPNLLRFKAASLEFNIFQMYERVHFFSLLTAQERFDWLMTTRPDYFERLQQKHLASYIGVSEVHMSRLKKQYEQSK
ncbi:MAG: Crp/Fnr family transcriptional regulator [Fluviicola sp.]